jgi:23S rRNA pseudouridine2457 synthase
MTQIILFNKPFNVMSQFSPIEGKKTLQDFIPIPEIYPAGRLDYNSEGLLILTDDGRLQHRLSDPRYKLPKTYWVQVEGEPDDFALQKLQQGIELKDGWTRPAGVKAELPPPWLWARVPPIRERAHIPTAWLSLQITEGRNHQVRRMTAAVGFPTLRLIRYAIGDWTINHLSPGEFKVLKNP